MCMRMFFRVWPLVILPLVALAQTHSDAPLLAVGNGAVVAPITGGEAAAIAVGTVAPHALPPNFPEAAVTSLARDAAGQQQVLAPANPPTPTNPAAPANPATPAAVASPPAPVSKLWPRDTAPIFIQSCAGFHPELIQPCNCIITQLMAQMPHDEFIRLSEAGTIEQDPRYTAIRYRCATQPQQHK